MSDQAQAEYRKPGVGDFLSLTFDYLKGDAKGLLRVLPLPWLLLVVLSGAMVWFTFGMATGGVPQFGSVGAIIGGTIVFMIAEYLVVSGLAVMTHRRMALGPQAAGGFRIGAREVFYLLKGIVFSFLLSLPWMLLVAFLAVGFAILPKEAWVFALVQSLGMLIGFCIMVLLTVRLMLALPAFAMDQHPGVIQPMKESWRRTRGCFWSLFLGGVVITMAAGMVSIVPMAACPAERCMTHCGIKLLSIDGEDL